MSFTAEEAVKVLDLSLPKARALARLVNFELEPDRFPSVRTWLRQCYNRPSNHELIMCAANELLGGHGVEPIRSEGAWVDSYHHDIIASHVNMGDTYTATVVLDHENDEFLLTSWGDWYEAWEAEQGKQGDDEECCDQCGDPFDDSGPGQRSACDASLCEFCYTNPEDEEDDDEDGDDDPPV